MNEYDKEVLKSNKPTQPKFWDKHGKKIVTGAGAFLTTLGSLFSFVGCVTTPTPPIHTPPNPPKPPTPPGPVIVVEKTYKDFIENYQADALQFFKDHIRSSVVGTLELVEGCESWRLLDSDGDNKIDSAQMTFISKESDSGRAVQLANIKLTNPIKVQDIIDKKVSSVKTQINKDILFEFDARENFDHQNICKALCNAAELNTSENTITVFTEGEILKGYRTFSVFTMTGSSYNVADVYVKNGDGTEETLLAFLKNDTYYTYNVPEATSLSGDCVFKGNAYKLEDLGSIVRPDPDPEKITDAQLLASLNKYCLDGVVSKSGIEFATKENLRDCNFYLTRDENGDILTIEYQANYLYSGDIQYFAGEVELENKITAQDLKDGKLGNVTYTREFQFMYNPDIQEEHQELTNAICDLLFGKCEGAERYIVVGPYGPDPQLNSMAQGYNVVQILNGEMKKASINIKESNNEQEYINKLADSTNYRVISKNSHQITGVMLTSSEESVNLYADGNEVYILD